LVIPANTLAELRRDIDRLRFVEQQIKKIETTRAKRLAQGIRRATPRYGAERAPQAARKLRGTS
jgi:hypothetical protein